MSTFTPLHAQLTAYAPSLESYEKVSQLQFFHLLENEPRCFWRDAFNPGHITGSAWVVNPARTKVLLLNHPKLNKWMQMGGHCDGDADVLATALREVEEESGYPQSTIKVQNGGGIFDLDIHFYPSRTKNGVTEPDHLHYDVRYLLEINDALPIPGSAENLTLRWVPFTEAATLFPNTGGRYRMLQKTDTRIAQAA